MSDETDPGTESARAYEDLLVPALFGQWASQLIELAGVRSGQRVLDVACGTGIVARSAVEIVGSDGSVTGLDVDAGMLATARSLAPQIDWRQGSADDLPFDDDTFDSVLSQFGLMFFPDRVAAVGEMLRCTSPGGRVAIGVWGDLNSQQAYPVTVDLLDRHAGPAAADALRAPFSLGDTAEISDIVASAGGGVPTIETRVGTARFPSVRAMVAADVEGWLPLFDIVLDEDTAAAVYTEADALLADFVGADGAMTFAVEAHLVAIEVG